MYIQTDQTKSKFNSFKLVEKTYHLRKRFLFKDENIKDTYYFNFTNIKYGFDPNGYFKENENGIVRISENEFINKFVYILETNKRYQ